MPELVFFRRGEEVLRFNLDGSKVILGRGERCDVVIPDADVSRQQVALSFEGDPKSGGKCLLEDLSGKGTVALGKKQTKIELPDGGDVSLGQWRAVYRQSAGGAGEAETELGQGTRLQPRHDPRGVPAQVRLRTGAKETVHKLKDDTFTAGKDDANDLQLKDGFVSSRHVKVTRRDGRFLVVDHASTNGTWVGNARLYEAEVPMYTTLRVGESELTLEPQGAGEKRAGNFLGIIGDDPAIRALAELVERVAPSSAAVAIFGESGTGKELVARAVHTRSGRAEKPFIPINCAAISKELIESELFGHEKGAFTNAVTARAGAFEEANGGTLLLDEIGELPLDLQAKLLRALESGEIKRVGASRPLNVDVRIVAATNRDLLLDARQGRFREDLFYRLCVVPLNLPPLRSRRGDIPMLVEHFLRLFTPKGQTVHLQPEGMQKLESHRWKGNVRELKNVVHRALLLRKGPHIEAADIVFDVAPVMNEGVIGHDGKPNWNPGTTMEQMLEAFEKAVVEVALEQLNGNRERVVKELGVSRSTLFKKMKEWGLTNEEKE
jgi:DNA-binding NtrC family response regulator